MEKFSGTYSAIMPGNQGVILTQDAAFINYVLKENHTNYHKSEFTADRAGALFGKGLLFSNGEYWLKQRRLIQPGFHQKKLQDLFERMVNTIQDFLKTFPGGNNVDVYPVVYKLSFDIIVRSLFDIPLSPDTMSLLSGAFSDLQDFLIKDVNQPFRKSFYPVTRADKVAFGKAKKIRDIFKDIVDRRRSDELPHNDLLDMLLATRYEDTGLPMTDEQIIDEILILIFAGHETTANTLSWLLYLLATRRDVVERLRVSFDRLSVYDSPKDEYLAAVINEGMRMYPPAWMTDRVTLQDDRFGSYRYPGGTIIILFFYGLHRHKDYWEDPSAFRPDRFLGDKRAKHFFPFGAGPRMCIGNNFAMAEMSFFLYSFLKDFEVVPTGKAVRMKALMTLRPGHVFLNITRRPPPDPLQLGHHAQVSHGR